MSRTSLQVLPSFAAARVTPGKAIKVSLPHLPNQGYPAMISVSFPLLTINWEAEYFRQLTKLLRGALLSTNFWNLVFNRPVDTASTEAEKITLSPFFIGNSKYPGTNKSSLKSYPRFCSSMYSML